MKLFPQTSDNARLMVREIFSDHDVPDEAARAWTSGVADEHHLDPAKDQVRLIRALRNEDPSLSLTLATYMARDLAKHR